MAQLYRCYDPDGGLLYVGVSLDAVRRLRNHQIGSPWFDSLANLTVEHFPTRAAALVAEQQAIISEHPKHNRFGGRKKRKSVQASKEISPGWTLNKREFHSQRIREGQARARDEGRVGGRRLVYPDTAIREAIRRHQAGETWATVAATIGISVDNLYARVRKIRREDANGKAT